MLKKSLRNRLLLLLVLPIALGLIAAGLVAVWSAWNRISDDHDAQMTITAEILRAVYIEDSDELKDRVRQNNIGHLALRVWDSNSIEYTTSNAVDFGPRPSGNGFHRQRVNGVIWRFLVLNDPASGITVELAEPRAVRLEAIAGAVLPVFLPLLALLLILPALVWLGLSMALQPLADLSTETERRSPEDLSPIAISEAPVEVHPLVIAINRLLGRLGRALDDERQLTNMAAHELRTPLTVIKTRLQSVMRSADSNYRQQGLVALDEAVDRASNLVNQLLTLARMGQDQLAITRINLTEVARMVAADMLPLALRRSQTMVLETETACWVKAETQLLTLVVRNLLDNAIKYTPDGGAITLRVDDGPKPCLSIIDSGRGITPERLALVMRRFYREPGTREVGAGLGLTIASSAVDLLGATLDIVNRDDAGGLHVKIILPAA